MKVYKENQFLVFKLDDGRIVKYDFAKRRAIGFSGKYVENIKSQLKGYTIKDVINGCDDSGYAEFLSFVRRHSHCENIGTLLEKARYYSGYEQIFSAGIRKVALSLNYSIDQIPKFLIKVCRDQNILLTNNLIEVCKAIPNESNLAFNLNYESLSSKDVSEILIRQIFIDHQYTFVIPHLIRKYSYDMKPLMLYLDRLKTYEALDFEFGSPLRDFFDYVSMMAEISPKFDKYPRNFLTTHVIAARNYNRLKQEFAEDEFKNRIDTSLEGQYGEYVFIYPKSTEEIKNEAAQQNNCVASYIERVIDGSCHILFLRKAAEPEKSLVTIEVVNNKIVQARQKFNNPVNEEEQVAIDKWNKKHMTKEVVA